MSNIMYQLYNIGYEVIMHLPDLLSTLCIMSGIFQCKLKDKVLPYMLSIFVYVFTISISVLVGKQDALPPIIVCIYLIIIFLCFNEKKLKKIILYFTSYICSYIITVFIIFLLILRTKRAYNYYFERKGFYLSIMLLNIIIVLLLSVFIKKLNVGIRKWIKKIPLKYYIIGLPGLFSCVLVLTFVLSKKNSLNSNMDVIAIFCMILICLFFIIGEIIVIRMNDSRKYHKMQNVLISRYLIMQRIYYKQILESDQEIRKFKHDINSHIGCMKLLSDSNKVDELSNYITSTSNKMNEIMIKKMNSGNDIVDTVLNYMLASAEKLGMRILLDGILTNDLKLSEYDLCTIFINTIENAMDACKKIDTIEEKTINIYLSYLQSIVYIKIGNPVKEPVNVKMLGKGTTKDDIKNHGFGLSNIIDTVEKYQGKINFLNENNKFIVEILLPNEACK